ncbi:MAG: methionyl-tRNA formyltransferase [candidate division Zixibacteria bacterium]|nr:methionyl-tRNA formyltransferase [candidate division Zixibacteria bacterium]
MRLVFMGTPEFATESLDCLNASKHEVVAVVTAPDKPRGRGRKITPSAVKETALKLSVPVLQPTNLKSNSFINQLKDCGPDLIVVVAFRILPEVVFGMPRFGSINLHASLLPKYRGAAPINWALINGETKTGMTTFLLNQRVDTGDLLLQREIDISFDDNFGSLHDKLMTAGADLLLETINGLEDGRLKPGIQSPNGITPAPKLTTLTGLIAWQKSAGELYNLVRGLSPYPGAYSYFNAKKIIILRAAAVENSADEEPGTVIESSPTRGITIACGQDALTIKELKPQGKKSMGSAEYVRGYHVKVGDKFGD